MVKLIKALFAFLLLILLSILLFATFSVWEKKDQVADIAALMSEYNPWYYSFSGTQLAYIWEKPSDQNWQVYVQQLSRFDSIYSLEDIDQWYDLTNEDLTLGKWLYVLDISDNFQKYNISGTSFELALLMPGKVFIDTRDISNITFVSLTASFELTLKDRQDNQDITTLYVYPNRIASFNANRLSDLKNADFLRVSQLLSPYNYINESLYNDWAISQKFSRLLDEDASEFIGKVLWNLSKIARDNTLKYDTISGVSVWKFPGFDYISEKMSLFKNEQKKKVFYQNIVLDELNSLFQTDKKSNAQVLSVLQYLENIKAIDSSEYENMISIVDYYIYIVLEWNDVFNRNQRDNFLSLREKIYSKKSPYTKKSFGLLGDIYRGYNFLNGDNIIESIPEFSELFFEDTGIVLQDNKISSVANQNTILLDYMSSHIDDIIITALGSSILSKQQLSSDKLKNLLRIININNPLREYIYFKSDSSNADRKLTGLERNKKMVDFLAKFMKKTLFEPERTTRNLLVVEPITWLRDVLSQLSDNVESIDEIYQENKILALKNKNKLLGYDSAQTQLEEYFLALSNYELYKRRYEIELKDVREADVFQDDQEDAISQKAFLSYISQFSWVNTSQAQVDVINGESYRVSELYINGSRLDFYLYPLSWNRIEDIYIDGNLQWKTYLLDQREFDLEEKYKAASGEEKNQYDFKRFFLNTLFAEAVEKNIEFQANDDQTTESKSVIAFKKEKLLWDSREFDRVKWYLPLKWENVVVSEALDIRIDDGLWISQDTRPQYYAWFNSTYKFSVTDHKFENVEIVLYDRYTKYKKQRLLLWWSSIDFIWEIHIGDFNNVSDQFFNSLSQIVWVHTTLTNSVSASQIDISYNVANKNTIFKFNLRWESYSLSLLNDTITYIKKSSKTVADNVKPSTLANVLNTLP